MPSSTVSILLTVLAHSYGGELAPSHLGVVRLWPSFQSKGLGSGLSLKKAYAAKNPAPLSSGARWAFLQRTHSRKSRLRYAEAVGSSFHNHAESAVQQRENWPVKWNFGLIGAALAFLLDAFGATYLQVAASSENQQVAGMNFILMIARLGTLNLLALIAVRFGLGTYPWLSSNQDDASTDGGEKRKAGVRDVSAGNQSNGNERARQIDAAITAQQGRLEKSEKRDILRNVVLVVTYLFVVGCSLWTALKTVAIDVTTSHGAYQAAALALCLVAANAEFFFLKNIVMETTADEPVEIPGVHNHPLYWTNMQGKGFAKCHSCNEKIGAQTGGYLALKCKVCTPNKFGWGGFDMCTNCYRKYASKVAEGKGDTSSILIGDKGPKPPMKSTAFQYFLRALSLLRPAAGMTFFAIISTCFAQALSAYLSKAQGSIVNALVKGSTADFHASIKIFGGIVLALGVLTFFKNVAVSRLYTMLYTTMASRLFRALLRQDIAFYDRTMTGQLTSRLTNDLTQATLPIQQIMNSLVANVVMLVVGFVICLSESWRLTVLAFTILSPVLYVNGMYSRWASSLQASQWTFISDAQGAATQALTNIRTVRSFSAEDLELEKYNEHMRKSMMIGIKNAWGQGGATSLSSILEQGASFVILYYGGCLVLGHSSFEVGSIVTFSYLWNRLSTAFQGVNENINVPVKAMSAFQRVFEILDLEPDIAKETGLKGPSAGMNQMEIEFKDVEFTYQSRPETPVLKKVSLKLEAGQTLAVVGKSGCGKSTISKLMLRFYDPQKGAILVNSVDLTELQLPSYRGQIGVVSQDTQLFRATIMENIAYGLREGEFTMEDVRRAARMANADEFIQALPEGYKTMVGEGGQDLSGGQKQRISIARALVRRPRMLLLDEATSALDAENEALVQAALDSLVAEMRGRCTILIIAHRLSTIKGANRIVVLDKGEIVEEGTHDQLLAKSGQYAAMISPQLQNGGPSVLDSIYLGATAKPVMVKAVPEG